MNIWQLALPIFITLSQILMAGVAINAFSLLLYASYFNLRDNVARTFVIILFCLVIIFSAEANKYQEKMEKAEAQLEYIEKELEKTKNDLWLIQAQLGDENGQ